MNFSKFKVGQYAEISKAFSSKDVIDFSKLSLDDNPIHIDSEYASNTIFKKRIVHGFLYSSLISAVIASKLPGKGAIYLKQEMSFLKPVYHNDKIRARVTISSIDKKRKHLHLETVCFNEKDEIVLEGMALIKC